MWRECASRHMIKKTQLTIMYNVYELIPGDLCNYCSVANLVQSLNSLHNTICTRREIINEFTHMHVDWPSFSPVSINHITTPSVSLSFVVVTLWNFQCKTENRKRPEPCLAYVLDLSEEMIYY